MYKKMFLNRLFEDLLNYKSNFSIKVFVKYYDLILDLV